MKQLSNRKKNAPTRTDSDYFVVSFYNTVTTINKKAPVFCFSKVEKRWLKEDSSRSKGFKDIEKALIYFIERVHGTILPEALKLEIERIRAQDEKIKRREMW